MKGYEYLKVGDKWNRDQVVIEIDDNYILTAELFKNGKPKRTTALIHTSGGFVKGWISK